MVMDTSLGKKWQRTENEKKSSVSGIWKFNLGLLKPGKTCEGAFGGGRQQQGRVGER